MEALSKWAVAVRNLLNLPKEEPKIYKPVPTHKVCVACKKSKDIFWFQKRASRCKPCQVIYLAEWRKKTKEASWS